MPETTTGSLRALLVLGFAGSIWRREIDLRVAPFPGLGIRVDVYELVRVDSVVVGDHGHDVTCICTLEGDAGEYTEAHLRAWGFEAGSYP